jgi:hypothetical protein
MLVMSVRDSEFSKRLSAIQDEVNARLMATVQAQSKRIKQLEEDRGRLDLVIVALPTFDVDGPGECVDRWVAAVEKAKVRLERRTPWKKEPDWWNR